MGFQPEEESNIDPFSSNSEDVHPAENQYIEL